MPGVCEPTTGAPAHEISIISGRFSGLPSCSGPSWMIQDSPPTRHRPNMWNCRNVKKSCMCAEKKKKNPAAVSASLHEKPGTARMKEEGEERISPSRSPRCFSSTVFNRTRSSWRYRSCGSDQIWVWRETVSVLELNQVGWVLRVSRFPLYRRVCAMKRESIQPLQGAFTKSGL